MSIEREPKRTSGEKKRKLTRFVGLCAGLALSGASGIGVAYYNSTRADAAEAALESIAEERNTCDLAGISTSRDAAGELVVDAVAAVKEKSRPEAANEQYDGLMLDAEFRDGQGNLNNGIVLQWPNQRLSLNLDSGPPSGPFNTGSFRIPKGTGYDDLFPEWSDGVYTVYRRNAVEVSITGLFTKGHIAAGVASVKCGQFVLKDQSVQALLGKG